MKKVLLSVAVIFSAVLLAACGGQEKKSDGKTEIEFFSTKPAENSEIMKAFVSEFEEKNPDIKVTFTAPGDARTVLKTRLTKNDVPDVIAIGGDAAFVELVGAGVLEDLSSNPAAGKVNDSYKDMLTELYEDEGLYAIPYATSASGVLFNKDLFEEHGVEIPKTWDEFIKVMETFKVNGVKPVELSFKDDWTTMPIWNSLVPSIEPENFIEDRLADKTSYSDEKAYEEVIEKFLTIVEFGEGDFMGTTYADGNINFAKGEAAMLINGSWTIPNLMETNPDMNVGKFAFPASNDVSKNYLTVGLDVVLAASNQTKNKEAVDKFIEFMTQEDISQRYIDDQFAFSAIKNVNQEDPRLIDVKEVIEADQVASFPDHYYPNGLELNPQLSETSLNKVNGMENKENVKKTLENIDNAFNQANVN